MSLNDNTQKSLAVAERSPNYAIEGKSLSYSITTKQGKFVPILQNCSISIPSGQLWMLLGPNGCGKSTLLKVLAGLLNPTHGTMYVKRPKSFVFQNPDHQVVMPTVEADVAFGLGKFDLTQDEVRSRVAKALDAVGMSNYLQRPVQTLSGGQKQRVAIAGALAETCEVLLLDELTTFLDETDQIGVIKAVKNSLGGSREVTALWVTHRLEELKFADGAVYMENGRVIMQSDSSISCSYKSSGDVQSLERNLQEFLKFAQRVICSGDVKSLERNLQEFIKFAQRVICFVPIPTFQARLTYQSVQEKRAEVLVGAANPKWGLASLILFG
ncbi:ABC transporter-like [Macleaya cordata]|uniref:ABC transporter-like n=1 Tax=Macleaya cordata TaxID=56857 RepID=A0A200QJP9_MACCD|nr:ABC transporter-like [Macleaya cordata]